MILQIIIIICDCNGSDKVYQLSYMPNPVWNINEHIIDMEYKYSDKNDPVSLKGRFKDLIQYVKSNDKFFERDNEKKCIVLVKRELEKQITNINDMLDDITECGYKYDYLTY